MNEWDICSHVKLFKIDEFRSSSSNYKKDLLPILEEYPNNIAETNMLSDLTPLRPNFVISVLTEDS